MSNIEEGSMTIDETIDDWSDASEINAGVITPEELYGVRTAVYERCSIEVRGILKEASEEAQRSDRIQLDGLSLVWGLVQVGAPQEFWENRRTSNIENLAYYRDHATNNVFNQSVSMVMEDAHNRTPYKPIGPAKLLQRLHCIDMWSKADRAIFPVLFETDSTELNKEIKELVQKETRTK